MPSDRDLVVGGFTAGIMLFVAMLISAAVGGSIGWVVMGLMGG